MLRKSMLAEGDCGVSSTDSAVSKAVKKATVVKKPNTCCARTNVECILVELRVANAALWIKQQYLALSGKSRNGLAYSVSNDASSAY